MLTYELKKAPGVPLYEALYRAIRGDILSGVLRPGEKLPSKRALAIHLDVSKITVETAYGQLVSEGYLRSREKVGYFVEEQSRLPAAPAHPAEPESAELLPAGGGPARFPFSVWSRLEREVMLDYGEALLRPLPAQGIRELRTAISDHLAGFRGMQADPRNILVGAGTDFLYNLLMQLLGREKVYGVEEPGYGKIWKIYRAGGVSCVAAPMDGQGVMAEQLGQTQVLHLSPSHHFPTGLVTPTKRRQELLHWLEEDPNRWIIEDDYDSEFRFDAHPLPAMASLDRQGRVIYLNSFSRSLAPSLRISYLVLPPALMDRFRRELGFYGCTVASFEQYTLARFLSEGYFEKHINRMRKFYRSRRNRVLSALRSCPYADKLTILEQDAGLHFLVKVDTRMPDEALSARWNQAGIPAQCLSSFYRSQVPEDARHCLVVSYAELSEEETERLIANLT